METKIISKIIIALAFIGLCIFGTACSHIQTLSKNDTNMQVERLPHPDVKIFKPDINLEEGMLVISGTMKKNGFRSRLSGHADIAIVDSKDSIIAKQSVQLFRRHLNRRSYTYQYSAEIPLESSMDGLKMRIAYHQSGFSSILDCGNNLAMNGYDFR